MENRARNLPVKVIPRDISESLGKLPPQAIDMEEAVLGAIMLESKSLEQVPFLKGVHFYKENHRIIFNAIRELKSLNEPVDMRTVVHQLRKNGHIELIGGAHVIPELTYKISSSANIEHHARVVVEHAIKRMLIEQASKIHALAYEDTTDVLDLLQRVKEDLLFLEERETQNDGPERIKQLWEKTLITTKPDEPPPLIMLGDAPICTPGNHSLLVGKKKSRKSLLVTLLLSIFLKDRYNLADDIAVFDTEQGKLHVWKGRDRLFRMTNQHIPCFYLRGMSPKERRDFISNTILHWPARSPRKLKIAVIDGIRDCMSNINDPDETTEVIVWLEKLTLEHNIHVIDILHLNKTDGNARGHIGSELLNKAECTIEVGLVDDKNPFSNSIVKCESSREKPFLPFEFTHGPTGLPEIIGMSPNDADAGNDIIKRLQDVFEGDALRFKELVPEVQKHFGIGASAAKKNIQDWVRKGWVLKSGKSRDPKALYKLVASPGQTDPPPTIPPPAQEDIQFKPGPDDLPF